MGAADDEGWFTDPYGLHEARWLSVGRATKLVRDAGVEAYDDPPDGPPTVEAVRIEDDAPAATYGDDLKRVDDPGDRRDGTDQAIRGVWDAMDAMGE